MRTFLNFFPQSLWTKLHALMFYLKSPRAPKYAFYCIKKNGNFRKVCSRFNPRSLRRVFSVHFFLESFLLPVFLYNFETHKIFSRASPAGCQLKKTLASILDIPRILTYRERKRETSQCPIFNCRRGRFLNLFAW